MLPLWETEWLSYYQVIFTGKSNVPDSPSILLTMSKISTSVGLAPALLITFCKLVCYSEIVIANKQITICSSIYLPIPGTRAYSTVINYASFGFVLTIIELNLMIVKKSWKSPFHLCFFINCQNRGWTISHSLISNDLQVYQECPCQPRLQEKT